MMNVLSLALLLTSIAAASIFSPAPETNPQVVREGHRLIVVEFERHVPRSPATVVPGEIASDVKEKFLDAASVLPNVGQGLSQPQKENLADAYKEEISAIPSDAKEKAVHLEESISDAVKKANQKAVEVGESAFAAVRAAAEKAKGKAAQIEESASEAVRSAAEKTRQKATNAAKSTVDTALKAGEHVASNISASAEKTADVAVQAAGELRRNLSDILRLAWELGRDAAACASMGVREAAMSSASVAHLLGFATAYGTSVWITFASSHVLASVLPRQQLGIVQSRLYPLYFRVVALSIGAAIVGHFLGKGQLSGKKRLQVYNLMAMLAIVLLNLFWVEPKATKAMFQMMKLEKEEGRGADNADVAAGPATLEPEPAGMPMAATTPIRDAFAARKEASKGRMSEVKKRLKRLNNYSSFLNVLALMGLSWHLVHLSQCLVSVGELCK